MERGFQCHDSLIRTNKKTRINAYKREQLRTNANNCDKTLISFSELNTQMRKTMNSTTKTY